MMTSSSTTTTTSPTSTTRPATGGPALPVVVVDTSKAAVENLFTNEDPYHVHKTLGFLSLLSYVVRLCMLGERDMGFRTYPSWTVPTVALHTILGSSSLLFRIPSRRISEGNRIWPQMRWHSICFVGRHSLLILLYWAEQHVWHCEPLYWANPAIVFLTFICVDTVDASVQYRSNTIRDLQAHPAARYFFTCMQFNALGNCLAGTRRSSLHYWAMFVMQMSAFGTTLRRKNIVVGGQGRRTLVLAYGSMLFIGLVLHGTDFGRFSTLHELALTTAVSRSVHLIRVGGPAWLGVAKSKYILWGMAAVFLAQARSSGPNPPPLGVWLAEEPQTRMVRVVSLGLLALQIAYGCVVSKRQLQRSTTKTKIA
jgi:hypothetical protein